MSVTSEPVTIRVEVQDANSGAVLGQTTKNLQELGAAGAAAGAQASEGLNRAGAAAHGAGGHFQTAFDQVRLLRTELGVQMPRAMESMIARSQMLMGAVQSMGGMLSAIGFGMIGVSLGKEVYNLYEKWLDAGAAVRNYQKEVDQAKDKDFLDTHSVETLTLRIQQASSAVQSLAQISRESNLNAWAGLLTGDLSGALQSFMMARSTGGMEADEMKASDALSAKLAGVAHERNLQQIEYNHALDGSLQGQQKISAELSKQKDVNAENRRYAAQMDSMFGNPASPQAGKGQMDMQNAIAERRADAETFNLDRQHAQELRRLREQATEAGLRGNALYAAQEEAAIAELRDKDIDSVAARNAIHEKFHNQEMSRLREEEMQVAQRAREAGGAGLTGIAAIRYAGQSRDQEILAKAGSGGYQSLADAQKDRESNWKETNSKIESAEQSFTDRIKQLSDESADYQISGFAKIEREGTRRIAALRAEFERTYGNDPSKADYADHVGELNSGIAGINTETGQDKTALAQRNAEETEQIEAQARVRLLTGEKQKTAAIEEEYQERVDKYRDALNAQEISQDDFNRRVAAAQEDMDAQLLQSAQETRQKIASEIGSLFSAHPLEALQRLGEKYAGQATAALLSHAFGMPGASGENPASTRSEGLTAVLAHVATRTPQISGAAASGRMMQSVAAAEIHVGQASIMVGGGSSAPGGFSSGGGGSSWMLGGGGSFGSSTGGFTSSVPALSSGGSGFASGVGTAMQGLRTAQSLGTMFGHPLNLGRTGADAGLQTTDMMPTGTLNADGSFTSSPAGSTSAYGQSMLGGGMTMSNAAGAISGGIGLFSAYKQGGVGGMMTGAMSGAELGMEVGGPIGAAIGAGAGILLGAFGGGEQARLFWERQGRPRMQADIFNYEQNGDYLGTMQDLQALSQQAQQTLRKMGMTGSRYWDSTARPEVQAAEEKLNREQRAGRSANTFSAAMYDIGTDSVPRTGMAVIHEGERVIGANQNERITRAIESGVGSPRMAPEAQDGDLHIHVHAIDTKDAMGFLMDNADGIRAALNKSYGAYGGLADVTA